MRVLVRAFRPLTGVSPTPLHVLCFQYIFGQSKIRLLLRKEKKILEKKIPLFIIMLKYKK